MASRGRQLSVFSTIQNYLSLIKLTVAKETDGLRLSSTPKNSARYGLTWQMGHLIRVSFGSDHLLVNMIRFGFDFESSRM